MGLLNLDYFTTYKRIRHKYYSMNSAYLYIFLPYRGIRGRYYIIKNKAYFVLQHTTVLLKDYEF